MSSLSLLMRLKAEGREICLLAPQPFLAGFLAELGFRSFSSFDDFNGWRPDLVLLGEPSRHLRSTRYPERWRFLQRALDFAGIAPTIAPCIWGSEAWSVFPGSYAPPGRKITVESATDSLADWLQLAPLERPFPLGEYRPKHDNQIVFNLSAGRAGEASSRLLPVAFWVNLLGHLKGEDVAVVAQPGDDERPKALRRACARAGLPLPTFPEITTDLHQLCMWLGQKGVLISPETGLCHLARMVGLPTLVMTPRKLVPFWYQPKTRLQVIGYQESIQEVEVEQVVTALATFRGALQ